MRAANTCFIWATVLSSVFLGLVLGGAVPSHASSPYTLEQFLAAPGCTSVDISPDRTRIYARTMFGDWDEGARAFNFSSYAQIRDYHAFDVPWSILVSADNLYLYGSHYYGGLVDRVSVATDTVVKSVDVGDWTGRMGFDLDRRFLFVNENTPGTGSVGSIKVIDTSQSSMPVVGTVNLAGEPGFYPVVGPDGANLYVTSWNAGTLYRISTSDYTIKKTYPGLSQNASVSSLSLDGTKVYVSDPGPGLVRVLDAVDFTQLETYSIPGVRDFSLSPAGTYALARSGSGADLQVFDMTSKSVVQTISTPTSGGAGAKIVWDQPTGKAYVPMTAADGGVAVIAPQPKTYGVFIGSNDYTLFGLIKKVNGQDDADKVYSKFNALTPFSDVVTLKYNLADTGKDPSVDIENALAGFSSRIMPGDNLVFFYSGHGSGSKTDISVDEKLAITQDSWWLSDNELTAWFLDPSRKDKWSKVNKLFLLDCCHGGGFWNGEDDDLVSLEHIALMAAAPELKYSYSDPLADGEGFFSIALEFGLTKVGNWAIADTDKNGLTVDELKWFLEHFSWPDDAVGYIKDGWPDDLVPVEWSVVGASSGDFGMVLPEPGTLSLLALGGFSMILRRRR